MLGERFDDRVDPLQPGGKHGSTDQEVGEGAGKTESGRREEEPDQQRGDRIRVLQPGELVQQESNGGQDQADQGSAVLDDDRAERRLARMPEEIHGRRVPERGLPSRLREALQQRGSLGGECDGENDPCDEIPFDRGPYEKLADGERDRQTAADQERRDRGDERPQEPSTAVAEGMHGV
jgi:hypothetical protein